jgi:hypothetical protein
MSKYLFIRIIRHADHTVFCVADGQKTYWHPLAKKPQPYSSGQQVKRSFMASLLDELNEEYAPVTITQVLKSSSNKKTLGDGEPLSALDPHFADQLIGGWMRAQTGKQTIKRRSPLSISAMRPLHPHLSNLKDESISFDRTGTSGNHKVIVRDEKGAVVPDEVLQAFLASSGENLKLRTFMPSGKVGPRATGIFVADFAVDLSRLFAVGIDPYDLELESNMVETLEAEGWIRKGKMLVCPKERRNELIPAIAKALINWRITSNQARTYSPQETLAVAIGTNASLVSAAIRGDLDEEEEGRAKVVIDREMEGDALRIFVSSSMRGYVQGIQADGNALFKAEQHIQTALKAYQYE